MVQNVPICLNLLLGGNAPTAPDDASWMIRRDQHFDVEGFPAQLVSIQRNGLDSPLECSRVDLGRFEQELKTVEGQAGRPCWPAQLLVSIWVYSYTLGVASARAIERMMSHEPAINYHTLADFRVGHKEALEELFAQLLALLEGSGVVDLNALLHDGTKVRAVAGRASLHRRKTLEKRWRRDGRAAARGPSAGGARSA